MEKSSITGGDGAGILWLMENALDFVHFFWIPSLETKEQHDA